MKDGHACPIDTIDSNYPETCDNLSKGSSNPSLSNSTLINQHKHSPSHSEDSKSFTAIVFHFSEPL